MSNKFDEYGNQADIFFHKNRDNLIAKRIFRNRVIFLVLLTFFCLSILVARLFVLQVLQHDNFKTLADSNRIKLLPIAPARGLIFDRNGVLLANNIPSFNLVVTPQELKISQEELYNSLRKYISLSDYDIERFERVLKISPPQRPILLRDRLTEDEIAKLSVNLYQLNGVEIQSILTRVYPHNDSAAHALGYVGRIDEKDIKAFKEADIEKLYVGISHIGKRGSEASFENILHGVSGYKEVETDVRGKILRNLSNQPAVAGKNIYLSLDIRLQKFIEKSMKNFKGSVVALDPNNGDILAFVSQPRFDPNLFVNGIDNVTYKSLTDSPGKPFLNRVLQGRYPPGSTIKPMVGLAGLELGYADKYTKINCPAYYQLPNSTHKFRDWNRYGHGYLNLLQSIQESCDIYFYDLAYRMGITNLIDYLLPFSLGTATGVDLLGESSGVAPTPEYKKKYVKQPWYPGDTVTAGIGQSYWLTTPLQLAQSTAVVAARGKAFKPKLLKATQELDGDIIATEPAPAPVIKLKDSSNWQYIIDGMIAVVHTAKGTGNKLGIGMTYKMAGKSGTAQIKTVMQDKIYNRSLVPKKYHDHALFIAFAPIDKPKIAVAVIVENGESGSKVAGPIAKAAIDVWLSDFKELPEVVIPEIKMRSE